MNHPAPAPPTRGRSPEYGRAFARVRDNPCAAPVFAPDATVHPVVLGSGLLAEVRTSGDGAIHVLGVQNLTGEPLTFVPRIHLHEAPVMFLCGATDTAETDGGDLVCQVPPGAFVWLGCFSDGAHRSAPPPSGQGAQQT